MTQQLFLTSNTSLATKRFRVRCSLAATPLLVHLYVLKFFLYWWWCYSALPRDGGAEKVHRDPTVGPRPKV